MGSIQLFVYRSRLRVTFTSLLLSILIGITGSAQTIGESPRERMAQLRFLLGEWKGKGYFYRVDGSKVEVSQSTKVTTESDGQILRFKNSLKWRDQGLLGRPLSFPEIVVSYDDSDKRYRIMSEGSRVPGNPFEVKEIRAGMFQWAFHTPDGMTRTTIKIDDHGEWHETLEMLLSEGWFKVRETDLRKAK